jgi:hypothetical protein
MTNIHMQNVFISPALAHFLNTTSSLKWGGYSGDTRVSKKDVLKYIVSYISNSLLSIDKNSFTPDENLELLLGPAIYHINPEVESNKKCDNNDGSENLLIATKCARDGLMGLAVGSWCESVQCNVGFSLFNLSKYLDKHFWKTSPSSSLFDICANAIAKDDVNKYIISGETLTPPCIERVNDIYLEKYGTWSKMAKIASKTGNLLHVKYAFDTGLINDFEFTKECICTASEYGHFLVVKFLYSKFNSNKFSAGSICMAARNGHLPIVKFLFSKGADITVQCNSPLRLATEFEHAEIVDFILFNSGSSSGSGSLSAIGKLLYEAVLKGHLDVLKVYVKYGMEITSFHLLTAAMNHNLNIIEYIVKAKPDIYICETTYEIAYRGKNIEFLKLLRSCREFPSWLKEKSLKEYTFHSQFMLLN